MITDDVNVDKIFSLAFKNHKENNFNEAEKLYKKILKINSSHFNSIFYLASLSAQTKNYSKAKNLFEKIIHIKPNYDVAYANLGAVLKELGNFNCIFIRAPIIKKTENCNILGKYNNNSILVRNKNILVSTFHPELSNNNIIHKYFINMCKQYFLLN